MVSFTRALLLLSAFATSKLLFVSGECTDCGLCYNHGGNYKCLSEYSPTCDKWHAMFDCPSGVPCETTNDPEKGRYCLEGTCPRCKENPAISTDNCCSPVKDGSTYAPTSTPPESTTWSKGQAIQLPEHEWVVLDHNDGPDDSSFGVAVAVSDDHVFVGGKTTSPMTMRNPNLADVSRIATAIPESADGDMFLAKVTLSGEPVSIHTFPGSEAEQPNGLAISKDGSFLSMVGYFRGTLTLGDDNYSNDATELTDGSDCGSNCPKDAFLAKISDDGSVMWSIHFAHQGDKSTELFSTAITEAGDIVYGGHIANTGRLGVVANDGVVKKWETVYDASVGPFNDVKEMANGDFVAVGSLAGTANFGGSVGSISSTYAGSREALVLVLDPETGYAKWAALMGSPNQYARASKGVLVATTDSDIYVACAGPCNNIQVSNNDQVGGVMMGSIYKGGVAKFSTSGEPKWISELPTYPQGLAAMTNSAVYVNFYESTPVEYGNDTFKNWVGDDTKDQFIIKFNPDDGMGEWVMQQGGTGKEYVRRMAMDKYGDIYTTGKTGSNPGYFDAIQMTAHDNSNKNDMFLAKMTTSSENVPACKAVCGKVKVGYCFFQNTCYEDGADMPPGDTKCVGTTETDALCSGESSLTASGASSLTASTVFVVLGVAFPFVIGSML